MFSQLLSAAKVSRKVVMPKARISPASSEVHCRITAVMMVIPLLFILIRLLGYICDAGQSFLIDDLESDHAGDQADDEQNAGE